MISLDEIKKIIFPKVETVDMKQVAISFILQKIGLNKLVSFDEILLYDKGENCVIYLNGLGVINNNIIVYATKYSRDNYPLGYCFGVINKKDNVFDKNSGIGLSSFKLMKACQYIFNNEKSHIEFDFNTMKSPDTYHTYLDELVRDAPSDKGSNEIINEFKKLKNGLISGYFEFYDNRLEK